MQENIVLYEDQRQPLAPLQLSFDMTSKMPQDGGHIVARLCGERIAATVLELRIANMVYPFREPGQARFEVKRHVRTSNGLQPLPYHHTFLSDGVPQSQLELGIMMVGCRTRTPDAV